MTTTITRAVEFDAGHRVATHGGKCRSPHGHRYRVEVTITGDIRQDGMVLDFGVLGEVLKQHIAGLYDHAMVLDREDPLIKLLGDADEDWKVVPVEGPPTAENFAVWIANEAHELLVEVGAKVVVAKVKVWETPNCWAEWQWLPVV